ncbi:hypothetical protein H2200_002691 [Cladophialophora chaetospira]|uniref:Mg2+ transporter protein, CorA-like/Zinc transport protein ZntB n=1 Tax=Cladophialophora chaetospira TaxID=386627 RepID=A0AA38XJG7_9EURO|nr:hypothetical protein H2200_002691 [Cladophialophora chaetospira]
MSALGAPCSYPQTYDFSTKWTTALVAWTEFSPEEEDHHEPLTHLLKLNHNLWSRAIFLPITILQRYVHFYEEQYSDNKSRLWDLEHDVGITRAGRELEGAEELEDWPGSIDVKALTAEAHAIAADLLIIAETLDWARRSILELPNMDVYPHLQGASNQSFPPGTPTTGMLIHETVDLAEGAERSIKHLQQRCQIQANVLYSAASQTDNIIARDYSRIAQENSALAQRSNELNLRIAGSTKKDSIAMMAFTSITALFLPRSYISSLFSMDMFNWMASAAENEGRVVSTRFWIYWAVTVPLTTTVMMGWYVWYRTADAAWRKEAKIEMEKEAADNDAEDEKNEDVEGGCEKSSIRSSRRFQSVKSGKT